MSAEVIKNRWWKSVPRTETQRPEPEITVIPRSLDAIWDQIKRLQNHKVQLQCELAKTDAALDDKRKALVELLCEIDKEDQIFKGTALRPAREPFGG